MKRIVKILGFSLFLICLLLIIASCNKEKKCERMIAANDNTEVWNISSYSVDGADSLLYLKDSVFQCDDLRLRFYGPMSKVNSAEVSFIGCQGSFGPSTGSWSVKDECSSINLYLDYQKKQVFHDDWTVLTIASSEILVEQGKNGKTYELGLTR